MANDPATLLGVLQKIVEKISNLNSSKADKSEIPVVPELPTDHISSDDITKVKKITKAQFDALDPKDPTTLYLIPEEEE